MKEKKVKTFRTALDSLPYGEETIKDEGKLGNPLLPQGVTRKQLVRDVLLLAWPCLLELILTQLTSMVDQMMVGRIPGQEGIMALSAVGLAGQPKFLLMTMIQALNVGSTAIIARFRGQQNQEKANQVYRQAMLLNLVMGVVMMLAGAFGAEALIRFMSGGGISEETLQFGVEYLKIQMYGFAPLALVFTTTAALRGIGDTKTPMLYNTIANVVNVVMNYLLIYGKFGFPRMGVAGASLATVIGQMVAFFIAMFVMFSGRRYISINFKEKFTFDKKIMSDVVAVGLPSMIEQLIMRAGGIIYTRTVAGLGDTLYATHNVCMNIQAMSFMLGQAFGNASTTLMGQSLGKRRSDMAIWYMKETRAIATYVSCALLVVMAVFGKYIVSLYNTTPEIVETGGKILLFVAFLQPIQAAQFVYSGGLRGAGDTKYTAKVTAVTMLGIRTMLGLLAVEVFHWSLWGAWAAIAADQVVRSVMIVHRYNTGKWRFIKMKAQG